MNTDKLFSLVINEVLNTADLNKGIYIVVLHATRIPPHIGLLVDKQYHSLTIKGQDCNTPIDALLRNINHRKIASLFIKINSHPIFSNSYLSEHFILNIKQFTRVDTGIATCLSPLKLFFDEVYNVSMENVNFLYDLLPALYSKELINSIESLFIDDPSFQLPYYTSTEINREIKLVRNNFTEKDNIII
ncbi:MAG: hypothetical protein ABI315_07400 [Bacteroidia bacterium]